MSAEPQVLTPTPVQEGEPSASLPRRVDLTKEYVSGGNESNIFARNYESLRWAIDDVTTEFGDDLYERMCLDPIVAATITILIASVIEEGLKVTPAVTDPTHPDVDLARTIADRARFMLDNLSGTTMNTVLWNLAQGTYLGNRVAETVWKYDEEPDGRVFLNVDRIKVKPRKTIAFVVDQYMNLVGLSATSPRRKTNARAGAPYISVTDKEVLPREKFMVYSFRPREDDPRGTSVLRPAFSTWVDKIQTLAERQKHMSRFASPSVVGVVGEDARPVKILDTNGDETGRELSPIEALYQGLLRLHNGVAMAVPFGTLIETIEAKGGGEVFDKALDYDDRQIVKVIITQTLATEDSQHQARAAAQVHQGTLNTIVLQTKAGLQSVVREDLLRVWVGRNWGPEAARNLVPECSLGTTEAPDIAKIMTAIATLFKAGFVAKSQLTFLDGLAGLPARLSTEVEDTVVQPPQLTTPVGGGEE